MFTIENDQLKIDILQKGAALDSIFHKQYALEYLWNADPAFWPKKSPVLFPIVGELKNNTYWYNGKEYHLSRHGFARDKNFSVTAQTPDAITFSLSSDEETYQNFPFHFQFDIVYVLQKNELTTTYRVHNGDDKEMYFSVGGHPAFKVPLVPGTQYDEYELKFNKLENAGRWPISKDGLIETEPMPLLANTDTLPLAKKLFQQDAIVFKHLQSDEVRLQSSKTPHGLNFHFAGFPYLSIWAAPNADFVCIEPWCGIADSVNTDQQLPHKEGIISLPVGETFAISWRATFF